MSLKLEAAARLKATALVTADATSTLAESLVKKFKAKGEAATYDKGASAIHLTGDMSEKDVVALLKRGNGLKPFGHSSGTWLFTFHTETGHNGQLKYTPHDNTIRLS